MLSGFVAATEQHDPIFSRASTIDPIPRAEVQSKFEDAFANRRAIAQGTGLNAVQPVDDPSLRGLISKTGKPVDVRASSVFPPVVDDLEHETSVA